MMDQVTKEHTFKALFVYSMRSEHRSHGDHHLTKDLEISRFYSTIPSVAFY